MNIPFVDLKSQYKSLKSSIDGRIHAVLEHGAFINGPEVAELEKKLADFSGAKGALAVASGTDALLIPMMALNIGPGDEVITSAFSFIATAEVIVLAGATPVYVDIDPATYNLDPQQVRKALTPRTRAIVPVSLYGQVAEMDELTEIAKSHGLHLLEDAAQSFGALYKGKRSCNLSEHAGTSFFPAKPLGCYGDGGAIFTQDLGLLKIMKEIREHGSETRYYHTRLGINGRLDTLQCAILLAKMERYQWELDQREHRAQRYGQAFSQIKSSGFTFPKVRSDRQSAWAQYTLEVPDRDSFIKKMTAQGVPTSVHYPRIIPDQPWYQQKLQEDAKNGTPTFDWSHARNAAKRVVSIPIYPDMTDEIQERVVAAVLSSL